MAYRRPFAQPARQAPGRFEGEVDGGLQMQMLDEGSVVDQLRDRQVAFRLLEDKHLVKHIETENQKWLRSNVDARRGKLRSTSWTVSGSGRRLASRRMR